MDKIDLESIIRGMASEVITGATNRRDHPSYGNTKTTIRFARERMEGAIGMYMVITEQAMHSGVPALAEFSDSTTTERVAQARREADSL
jgi:hypothetical protein